MTEEFQYLRVIESAKLLSIKGATAYQEFIKHHAKCIDIRTCIDIAVEFLGLTGSVYTCTDADAASCRQRELPPSERQSGLVLEDAVNERGHHGLWLYPQSTAAPPAKSQ